MQTCPNAVSYTHLVRGYELADDVAVHGDGGLVWSIDAIGGVPESPHVPSPHLFGGRHVLGVHDEDFLRLPSVVPLDDHVSPVGAGQDVGGTVDLGLDQAVHAADGLFDFVDAVLHPSDGVGEVAFGIAQLDAGVFLCQRVVDGPDDLGSGVHPQGLSLIHI